MIKSKNKTIVKKACLARDLEFKLRKVRKFY
jgi:hypothetical protein